MVTAKVRIPKKKLMKPDEFVSWGSKAMNYALANIRYIVLGTFLAAAIIVALFLWRQHEAERNEIAYTLLGKGIILYQREESREEARSIFSALITDYPRTKANEIALLYRGRYYMLQKDYDRAIEDLKLSLKRSSTPLVRVIALNALGNAYWAKGEYRQAIDFFQKVVSSGDEWMKPYVLLQMGMCWEKLGDKQKAAKSYQDSVKFDLPSPWGTLARIRLQKLEGKGEK